MVGQGFNRYTLYGEEGISLPPEFVHLERISDRAMLHDWTIEPHAHPHMMQLLLLQNGGVELHGERRAEALAAPAQVLVPPTCVHAFRFDAGAEGWVLSVAADLANDPRLSGLLGNLDGLGGTAIAVSLAPHPLALHRLGWLLDDLAQRLGQGDGAGPPLLAQVALVLATALEARSGNPDQAVDGREPIVARFRALVERHYREHLSVADYAAMLGTTTSTLTRATRALAGKPPAEIVHDRLILEARRNLAFSGASAAQIAYALGFADPAYFARFFKARTGQTTSAFRRDRVSNAQETA